MTERQVLSDHKLEITLELRAIARLAFALLVISLPAVVDRRAIADAAALFPLAESANHPYWIPSRAMLLYVRAPAAAISACVLFLAPGLLLALAMGMARTIAVWVLAGFMLSVVAVSVAAAVVQMVIGAPLTDWGFVATVAVCLALSASTLWWRAMQGKHVARPWSEQFAGTSIAVLVLVPLFLLVSLAPKFYWDSFNGDGAHTFEATRLLLQQPLPFFGPRAGGIAVFPGVSTMLYVYPASWFMRLFGDVEATVRLPFILELTVLWCAIVSVIEYGRMALSREGRWLVAFALVTYAVTMTFSAAYSPYSADIALPATQDTLVVAMFLAYVLFFLEGRLWWMTFAIVLTYLSLVNGLLLILLWLVAVLFRRPLSSPVIVRSLISIAACMFGGALLAILLRAIGLPAPGREYGFAGMLRYFAFLQFSDWHRFIYVLVPSGIIPFLALFAYKRHDDAARPLALATLAYFALFFVQGHVALHHFVPVMILPLVVFWRAADGAKARRNLMLGAVTGAALISLFLSLPRDAGPETVARRVGFAIDDRTTGYDRSDPRSFRRADLLTKVFPSGWEASVPEKSFGGSPRVWLYYAHHAPAGRVPNYVLQPRTAPAPAGMRLLTADEDAALYLRSDSVWRSHLSLRPPTAVGSAAYEISRSTMLRSVPAHDGPRIFSVVDALGFMGLDTALIIERLGVKR
jgi:hypothetical protein